MNPYLLPPPPALPPVVVPIPIPVFPAFGAAHYSYSYFQPGREPASIKPYPQQMQEYVHNVLQAGRRRPA